MKKSDLKKYAKLIVKKGANVQKGQDVIINCSVDNAYFGEMVAEAAYKAKARKVKIEWHSETATISSYKYEKIEDLSEFPKWREEKYKYMLEKLPAIIHIIGEDPNGMKKVDSKKMMNVHQNVYPKIKKYRDQMENKYQWTIVAVAHPKWAKVVFPNDTKANGMKKLWDAIFKTTRVYGDPIKNWEEHNQYIFDKLEVLNKMNLKTLKYKSENGTDFQIELFDNAVFAGGGTNTLDGVFFNANMPTEECFTSPNPLSAQGVVMATKPLSVRGQVVSDFGFKFEKGKVIEIIAKNDKEKEILENLINTDEGASRLGEVALVPYSSPINQTNLLFYNTLFDENACCHIALGKAFTECIRGYENMSIEELEKQGLNDSMIHVDFMIGSKDLSIVGTTYDGKTVSIFEEGEWVF